VPALLEPPRSRALWESDAFDLVEERQSTLVGRWTIVAALPRGPLADQVEAVWASRGEGVFTQEEILPRTPTEVLFPLGDTHWLRDRDPLRDRSYTRAFVSGLHLGPLSVESPSDAEMAGIRLRPPGAAAFLRDSPASIAASVVDLDLILGSGVERLRERLAALPELRDRVRLLFGAVARHVGSARPLSSELRGALHAIHARPAAVSVRRLAADSGWSHRHFTARFEAEVGVRPKTYARIARFEAAFAALQTLDRVRWAEFALDRGYSDQAHLVREFRELAGATPTEVLRRRAPDGLGLLVDEDEGSAIVSYASA
jgi:AraC-like DNA-binding protein